MTTGRDNAETRKGSKAPKKARQRKLPRIPVFELREKLAFLRSCHPTLTKAAMCEGAGIQPTSLERAIGQGNAKRGIKDGDGRLGYEHQRGLGIVFGFPAVDTFVGGKIDNAMWPEWRDVSATAGQRARRDSCQAFKDRYLLHIQAQKSPAPQVVEEPPPAQLHDGDPGHLRQNAVRLGPGPQQPVRPLTRTIKLASVSIEGQQWGEGSVAILLTLACNKYRELSVVRGRITIAPGTGRMTSQSFANWQVPRTLTGGLPGHTIRVVVERGGTRFDPHLDISGVDGPIGTVVMDSDLPALEDLAPGDEVVVTFGTWLADVGTGLQAEGATVESAAFGSDGLGVVDKDGKSISVPPDALTAYQRWAIAIIRQDALGEAGRDGYIELSTHVLRIGRAP